jgi:pyruvate dehydrogenase E2 component (dihydrolipoamide acetyltransferase)
MSNLEFPLPDIGEGVHEGEIVQWLIPEGGAVAEDDPVVEIMTDKATVEIPSPGTGVIAKHLFGAGEVANVGDVIFIISSDGAVADSPPSAPAVAEEVAEEEKPVSAPVVVEKTAPADLPAVTRREDGKVLAAPATRRLARELGVDLTTIRGSGPNGRIRPEDVRTQQSAPPAVPTTPTAPAAVVPTFAATSGAHEEERTPFRGIRRKTAEAMSRSKFTAPHFSLIEEVDCTDLVDIRNRAKVASEKYGIKVTYMPYIMKAAAIALMEYPQLNAMLDEEAQEVVVKKYVNLGIAVDTPNGLMVPVVKDVHLKGLLQISAELAEVASRAREGKAKAEDFQGSTFTISNAGNIGGILATPIINFPEVAIMGVHSMRKMPRCIGDDIVARQIMNLSISIDHRLVDGADGARFMVRMRELLEDPALMLL